MKTYKSKILSSVNFAQHCFFGNSGGISTGVYSSLNTSYKVGDLTDNVSKNRAIIAKCFSQPKENLFTVNQVHGTEILEITKYNANSQLLINSAADGMITHLPNIILGVYTADCVPLLFIDNKSKYIGALHCGWKGLLYGGIENMVNKFKHINKNSDILVGIGPCIKQSSYEVNNDFYNNFTTIDMNSENYFSTEKDQVKFDITGYAKHKLLTLGTNENNIEILNYDTFADSNFFSHRRASKKNETRGLQLSCIMKNQ
jgi:hypothetical protein